MSDSIKVVFAHRIDETLEVNDKAIEFMDEAPLIQMLKEKFNTYKSVRKLQNLKRCTFFALIEGGKK